MIRCHVMEPVGRLANFKKRIETVTVGATTEIIKKLPIADVDIVYYVNPLGTIAEVGVCGYAPTSHIVFMSLDPENPALEHAFEEEIPATLAHELHHCMRWRGPGYGRTLLEALVTEGLARDFELCFRKAKMPEYHGALSKAEIDDLLERAKIEFFSPSYNHSDWFFGSEDRFIPKYAGYVLGHHIVQQYTKMNRKTSAELWNESAASFAAIL